MNNPEWLPHKIFSLAVKATKIFYASTQSDTCHQPISGWIALVNQ